MDAFTDHLQKGSAMIDSTSANMVGARIHAEMLGNAQFRSDYGIKYSYLTGAMYRGIASEELVTAMGKAGLMGFFGTGGLTLERIEQAIRTIQASLASDQAFGMNLLADASNSGIEDKTVDIYLRHGIKTIEAAAFMTISPALVRFRLKGVTQDEQGRIIAPRRIIAKVSRPEVAGQFMRPAPERILKRLLESGELTEREAELGRKIPMAQDICVEADSGGHTDQGVAYALMPAMMALRQQVSSEFGFDMPIRIGAAGGLGTPHAIAASFLMGADFVVTGSVNQCTVEAGTSDEVKDLLQEMNVQDTAYAPAGDMFEIGAKVQVLKKGLFFPMRANKLYELYQQHDSLDDIDDKTRAQIEEKYFRRTMSAVWQETQDYLRKASPHSLADIASKPKQKMAAIFKWYFAYSTRIALAGDKDSRVDYQVQCGPALGAFNQWIKGSSIENWRSRHVADIAERLMQGTAELMTERLHALSTYTPR
jgi:trans-AT polyketide synthase/acyltransferase/oxidoreductase domain-containing protein